MSLNTKEIYLQQIKGIHGIEIASAVRSSLIRTDDLPREQATRVGYCQQSLLRMTRDDLPQRVLRQPEQMVRVFDRIQHFTRHSILKDVGLFRFCERNPISQIDRLTSLMVNASFADEAVPVVCPVCPDSNQYQLKDGIGTIGMKAIDTIPDFQQLFSQFGFRTNIRIDVADVEALDPVILKASGETTESHFAKTAISRQKITFEITNRGIKGVNIASMAKSFDAAGADYLVLQRQAINRLQSSTHRSLEARKSLLNERVRLGNFSRLSVNQFQAMVDAELAGYVAYGQLIGGRAVIMSPDAMSAIPAYNFFIPKDDIPQRVNPVVYVKNPPKSLTNNYFSRNTQ